MVEWLLSPIDLTRAHEVSGAIAWHGRLMVLAWCFLIPAGIIAARFFKIMPGQDWPNQLDNPTWWYTHLFLQYSAGALVIVSLWMVWDAASTGPPADLHRFSGWATVGLCALQFLAGWMRGTKGGPTEIERTGTTRGDHYDMSKKRIVFEHIHKSVGYICLLFAIVSVYLGLWLANAQVWMFAAISVWWIGVFSCFVFLQKKGRNFDTYQAIWGPDRDLSGNKMKPIGFGITLPGEHSFRTSERSRENSASTKEQGNSL